MLQDGYIEGITFYTNHLYETVREEDGIKIGIHRPGLLPVQPGIIFWVHSAADLDTLEERVRESNIFYAQYNEHVWGDEFDYLKIKLDKYSQLPSIKISGNTALQTLEEVKGELTGQEELPPPTTGERVSHAIFNTVPGLGYLAGKIDNYAKARTMRPLREDVLEAPSLQFLIGVVQYLIRPRD